MDVCISSSKRPNYLCFPFYFVSFLVLVSWEDPELLPPSLPAEPCPPLTMSTHTRQHTLLRADERLGPNDKVPRPLNTSKIELWGGHDTPTADPPAPPVSTTISRSLNQTRTGAEATEPPSAPGLPTQTQEAGKHLPWTVETHKPTHTPTRSVTTHTHTHTRRSKHGGG